MPIFYFYVMWWAPFETWRVMIDDLAATPTLAVRTGLFAKAEGGS